MKLNIRDIGTTIAERRFEGHATGGVCTVVVKLGIPFPDADNDGCWYCPYSISKGSDQRLCYGAGVDSLQALRIAISMIEVDLKSLYSDLRLTWMEDAELGLTGKA